MPLLIARRAPRRNHRRACMAQLLRFTIRGQRCTVRRFLRAMIFPSTPFVTRDLAFPFSMQHLPSVKLWPIYRVDMMLIQLLMTLQSRLFPIAAKSWGTIEKEAIDLRVGPKVSRIPPHDSWESIAHLSHKRKYHGSIILSHILIDRYIRAHAN